MNRLVPFALSAFLAKLSSRHGTFFSRAITTANAGFHLQLSGHTHGGQFWSWNFLVRLQQPFTVGLHRLQDLRVYVNRGTGYWGPPKHFGAPSEVAHLRLVREDI